MAGYVGGNCPTHGRVKRYSRTRECTNCAATKREKREPKGYALSTTESATPMLADALHALITKLEGEAVQARRLLRELTR